MEKKKTESLISAFDVIGPVMVGPSSSHTAGALRISLLARSLLESALVSVEFRLYGSFARTYSGHGTDRALLAGALGFKTDDLRIRDAFELAQKANLQYRFIIDVETKPAHPNTVDMLLKDEKGNELFVRGVSVGGGRALLTKINDVDLEFSGTYHTLLISHKDIFGVLSSIVERLSLQKINIANLKCSRKSKGDLAITLIEVDDEVSVEDRNLLSNLVNVHQCLYIKKIEV